MIGLEEKNYMRFILLVRHVKANLVKNYDNDDMARMIMMMMMPMLMFHIKKIISSAGCPSVSVTNTTENFVWACDPYIGESITIQHHHSHCQKICMVIFKHHCVPGQLIYVNCYGVTSAAYVLLTTLVQTLL